MVLCVDSVVELYKILLTFSREEEITLAMKLIMNGTVRCCMGFLLHYMTPKAEIYDRAIMEVTEIYDKHSKSIVKCKNFITTLACMLQLL